MQLTPFQASYPRLAQIDSIDEFLHSVKEDYLSFARLGGYQRHPGRALYVYQIDFGTQSCTGVVAGVPVEDFVVGKIRAHEMTIAEKEDKQLELLRLRKASVKPILLSYRDGSALVTYLEELVSGRTPDFRLQVAEGQEVHQFWGITTHREILAVQQLFQEHIPHCYIADGHHRIAATVKLHQERNKNGDETAFGQLFCAFFSSRELKVFDFKRILQLSDRELFGEVLEHMAHYCHVQYLDQPALPRERHQFTMYYRGSWYLLRWKDFLLKEANRVFDAILLHERIFTKLLGVKQLKEEQAITYLPGLADAATVEEAVDAREQSVGFCLFPLGVKEIFDNSDEGVTLPPKSTWFEPRLKNGLMVMDYNTSDL